MISVNICWRYPIKPVWRVLLAVALAGAVAVAQETPKKISKVQAMGLIATKVAPEYPAMARQLKIAGVVELDVVVSETGDVTKVEIVKGNPILTAAGAQAVKRWKFKPFLEDGKPVAFAAPVELDFKF